MNHRTGNSVRNAPAPLWVRILQGCGIGAGVILLLLILFALLLLKFDVSETVMNLLTTSAACVGALTAGFFCARLYTRQGLVCGISCGAVLFAVLYLISLLCGAPAFSVLLLVRVAAMLIFASSGGVLGVNAALKRKY